MADVLTEFAEASLDERIASVLRHLAEIKDAAIADARAGDAEWLEVAGDQLRRARFHERECYARWQEAERTLTEVRALLAEHRGSKSRQKRQLVARLSAIVGYIAGDCEITADGWCATHSTGAGPVYCVTTRAAHTTEPEEKP